MLFCNSISFETKTILNNNKTKIEAFFTGCLSDVNCRQRIQKQLNWYLCYFMNLQSNEDGTHSRFTFFNILFQHGILVFILSGSSVTPKHTQRLMKRDLSNPEVNYGLLYYSRFIMKKFWRLPGLSGLFSTPWNIINLIEVKHD